MGIMQDSMAYPGEAAAVDLPGWKTAVCAVSAILLGLLFLVSGGWKVTDPIDASVRLMQAKVPGAISLPFTVLLGIGEVFAAVLLLVPRFRRWGAWLTGLMLVAFMGWVGYHYDYLRGAECSCFPMIKRAVGPGFFLADGAMLAMAVLAGLWSRRPSNLRGAAIILGAVSVFAAASYGVTSARQTGTPAPASIQVDGKAFSLEQGRYVLYFYDPECMHCFRGAQELSKHNWVNAEVIAVPTRLAQFGQTFLNDTKLKARVSSDVARLKQVFPFGDPPYAVAIEGGRQKAALARFDDVEPAATLRKLGFIQ